RPRDVGRQSPGLSGLQLQAPERRGVGARLPLADHALSAGARTDRDLQPVLLRRGSHRPRPPGDSSRRGASAPGNESRKDLAASLRFHPGARAPPPPQRDTNREVLLAPVEGGAAKAVPA